MKYKELPKKDQQVIDNIDSLLKKYRIDIVNDLLKTLSGKGREYWKTHYTGPYVNYTGPYVDYVNCL